MTIYSLYIFDRHCQCVYYQDWHRTKRPKQASKDGLLPGVSRAVSPAPPTASAVAAGGVRDSNLLSGIGSVYSSPRNTLVSSSGVVVAVHPDEASANASSIAQSGGPGSGSTGIPFEEEAKLVYGVVFSLRTMVKKLSKRDEQFTNYRTSTYRMHLYESATGYKFILLTDPQVDSAKFILRQLYSGPFLEYVVRNPLSEMDSREKGIDNEYFRTSVDRLIRGLSIFP